MKPRLAPAHLAIPPQHRSHFGSVFRRSEPILRIGQLILLLWGALAGAKLLAQALVQGAGMVAGLLP